MNNIKYIYSLSKFTYRYSPRLFAIIFALNVVEGLTTGIGFLILIPLFHLTGLYGEGSTSSNGVNIMDYLGFSPNLLSILVSYVVIVSAVGFIQYIVSVSLTKLEHGLICDTRDKFYRGVLTSDWEHLINQKRSYFINLLTTQINLLGLSTKYGLMLLGQLILVSIYLLFSFFISWQVTILALTLFMLVFVVTIPINRKIVMAGAGETIDLRAIYKEVVEQFANIKLIKTHAIEGVVADKLKNHSNLLRDHNVHLARSIGGTKLAGAIIGVLSLSGISYIALTSTNIAFSTLLIMLVVFARIWPVLSNAYKSYQMLIYRKNTYADLIFSMEELATHQEHNYKNMLVPMIRDIRLRRVCFSYKGEGSPVKIFKDLSLTIPCKSTVALIGASGAGKTTLADLVAGLLTPDSGEILCDDILLEGNAKLAWRRQVAYITQDPLFFNSSIKENLLYLNDDNILISEDDILNALRSSGSDFVFGLVKGVDTNIGDSGIRLSGGQKQRLAIARALLRKPQLLILDEATSALDRENEKTIQEALYNLKGKITILVIAHRSEITSVADQVIDVNQYSIAQI